MPFPTEGVSLLLLTHRALHSRRWERPGGASVCTPTQAHSPQDRDTEVLRGPAQPPKALLVGKHATVCSACPCTPYSPCSGDSATTRAQGGSQVSEREPGAKLQTAAFRGTLSAGWSRSFFLDSAMWVKMRMRKKPGVVGWDGPERKNQAAEVAGGTPCY